MNVALWPCELGRIFHLVESVICGIVLLKRGQHLYQDDEPQIVPHVVLLVDMILNDKMVICSLAFTAQLEIVPQKSHFCCQSLSSQDRR